MEAKIDCIGLEDIIKNDQYPISVNRDTNGTLLNYKDIFQKLTELFIKIKDIPDWIGHTGTWNERERAIRKLIAKVVDDCGDVHGDIANVAFAAQVFADDQLMSDAANFYTEFYDRIVQKTESYKNRLKEQIPYEAYHNWPKKQGNITYHGYAKMVWDTGWATLTGSVLGGLDNTIQDMKTLQKKLDEGINERAYVELDEEINKRAYVGRAMLLLRDANKMDKADKNSEYTTFLKTATINGSPIKTYIVGEGVSESRDKTKRFGLIGKIIGLLKGQWTIDPDFKKEITVPYKLYGGKVDPLSERIGMGARTGIHEIMQGMSGSTIDYFTWVLFMLTKLRDPVKPVGDSYPITASELTRAANIFQVNYASWLGLAPLSMYHTQHESLSVLTDLVADVHLVNDIVCPFRNDNDFKNLRTAYIDEHPVSIAAEDDTWRLAEQRKAPPEITNRMRLQLNELRKKQDETVANLPTESMDIRPGRRFS